MKTNKRLPLVLLTLVCAGFVWPSPAKAEPVTSTDVTEARWGFNTDLGLWTGTTNNTAFALGFGLDYYMDRNFSFGGSFFAPR